MSQRLLLAQSTDGNQFMHGCRSIDARKQKGFCGQQVVTDERLVDRRDDFSGIVETRRGELAGQFSSRFEQQGVNLNLPTELLAETRSRIEFPRTLGP